MAATSTSVTSTTILNKWNSSVNAEDTFDVVFAQLKSKMILEGVYHCCDETECDDRISPRPPLDQQNRASYTSRLSLHTKSVLKLAEQSNKAMGLLMNIFDPDCNCHRELTEWFQADLPFLDDVMRRRKDFNFRNAWENWIENYRPNKEVNLQSLKKKFDGLTDEDLPFAEFAGQYQKLYKDMADIGHPPTVEHCYEMLRNNVKNINLRPMVIQLNLPEARRMPIDEFLENCLYIVRNSKHYDSGRKRKADENIVGRTVTVTKPRRESPVDGICFRCGEAGHWKFDNVTRERCTAAVCTLCHANIGKGDHDAKTCCQRSQGRFGTSPKSDSQVRGKSNGQQNNSQRKGKRGKKNTGQENPSHYGPAVSSTSTAVTVPNAKEASHMRARLALYDAAQKTSGRRVTSEEDDGSRA